jgi:hypothetical protein
MGKRTVDRFVRRENIKHYQELLNTIKDEAERQRILKLLAEEQQKQKEAGDKIEGVGPQAAGHNRFD